MKLNRLLLILFLSGLSRFSMAVKRGIHATIVESGEINGGGGGGGGGHRDPCKFINEVYKCEECHPEPTCERPYPRGGSGSCNTDCGLKCLCKRGYVRNRYGACIRLRECRYYPPLDPECKDRCAVYDCIPCYAAPTCDNPYPHERPCPKDEKNCKMDCICRKPYVLNEHSGKCVRLRDCFPYDQQED